MIHADLIRLQDISSHIAYLFQTPQMFVKRQLVNVQQMCGFIFNLFQNSAQVI